jgi:hypothetical protein
MAKVIDHNEVDLIFPVRLIAIYLNKDLIRFIWHDCEHFNANFTNTDHLPSSMNSSR